MTTSNYWKQRADDMEADLAAAKALLRGARGCLNEAEGADAYLDLISHIDALAGEGK